MNDEPVLMTGRPVERCPVRHCQWDTRGPDEAGMTLCTPRENDFPVSCLLRRIASEWRARDIAWAKEKGVTGARPD